MVRCQLILSKSYKCKNGVACFCALFLHKFSVIVFAVRLRAYMETDRSMFIFPNRCAYPVVEFAVVPACFAQNSA